MLVTSDIIGAFQNIPQEDGMECLYEVLEERENQEVSYQFISKLMELIQTCIYLNLTKIYGSKK